MYDCYDTDFENPECKPVFLRNACYAILGLYQEHNAYLNNYYEGEKAEDDFSWADGTSTGGDGADEFEVELDELE